MWIAPAVGAAVAIGGAIWGSKKSSDNAKKQAEASNEATQRQLEYDNQLWNMQHDKIIADRDFAVRQVEMAARNEGKIAAFSDAQNLQRYNYDMMIRNREQESLNQQYLRSDDIYNKQITLNALTAKAGKEDEYRKLQEIYTESRFNLQQLNIEQMQAEGASRARGSGRSARKQGQVTYADLGRTVAQINESLSSAGRNTRSVIQEISRDHISADLASYAAKMLDPGVLPEPIKPFKTPMADFLYPRQIGEYDFGPRPVAGAYMSPSAAANQVWGSTMSSVASHIGTAASTYISSTRG